MNLLTHIRTLSFINSPYSQGEELGTVDPSQGNGQL